MRRQLVILLACAALLAACAPDAAPVAVDKSEEQSDAVLEKGEALFRQFLPEANYACVTCHLPDSTRAMLGPGLLDIGVSEAKCDPQQSLEAYLRESILEPEACLLPGYPAGLMPAVYANVWGDAEIDALVAWLLSLRPPEPD